MINGRGVCRHAYRQTDRVCQLFWYWRKVHRGVWRHTDRQRRLAVLLLKQEKNSLIFQWNLSSSWSGSHGTLTDRHIQTEAAKRLGVEARQSNTRFLDQNVIYLQTDIAVSRTGVEGRENYLINVRDFSEIWAHLQSVRMVHKGGVSADIQTYTHAIG